MAESYGEGSHESLAQKRARIAGERGQSGGIIVAERERRRDRALEYRWHLLRHHPERFTRPTAQTACHLHR